MQERWKTFLSEVLSDALPTHSKLLQSGKSVVPLCPLCNEYEEDNLHLFFKCHFSRQAWLLAAGVSMDMLAFGSVKEAVDAILKPNDARFNILPPDVEPSRFAHKGVALMHAIWTHRNQVCFDNVSPNVIQMLKDHPDASNLYGIEPPPAAAQLTCESPTQTQEQFAARATGRATLDTHGCEWVASDKHGSVLRGGDKVLDVLCKGEVDIVLKRDILGCVIGVSKLNTSPDSICEEMQSKGGLGLSLQRLVDRVFLIRCTDSRFAADLSATKWNWVSSWFDLVSLDGSPALQSGWWRWFSVEGVPYHGCTLGSFKALFHGLGVVRWFRHSSKLDFLVTAFVLVQVTSRVEIFRRELELDGEAFPVTVSPVASCAEQVEPVLSSEGSLI